MNSPDVSALCAFLDDSPSPAHAVRSAARILTAAGFSKDTTGNGRGRHFVANDGSLIAWDARSTSAKGFRIVAAHTDSPGFRVKPHPVSVSADCTQIGMEVYGGPLLNSWLDRDLGLAGTVLVGRGESAEIRLVRDDHPVLRIPQLAIHLDRQLNEKGLVLGRQQHLRPIWAIGDLPPDAFVAYLAELADTSPEQIRGWNLMPFDTATATTGGRSDELVLSARLDDLFCAHAALAALCTTDADADVLPVVVLVDHEEVGSVSATGAQSRWVARVLEQISSSLEGDRTSHPARMASSCAVSADMAHATHPNYLDRHDPEHPIRLGGGPVVKHNAQQRYATSLTSMAPFLAAADSAGVRVQHFVSHSDMPCGSTIGPSLAAGLGIPVVDVGVAQLSMHSIREVCSGADHATLQACFTGFLNAR